MNAKEKTAALLATVLLVGAAGLGLYGVVRVVGPLVAGWGGALDGSTVLGVAGLLLSAWIVSRGISHRSRREGVVEKVVLYERLLAALVEGTAAASRGGADERAELERRLVLTARRGLLDRYQQARALGPDLDVADAAVRSALERLVVAMRRDLGRPDGPFPPEGLVRLATAPSSPTGPKVPDDLAEAVRQIESVGAVEAVGPVEPIDPAVAGPELCARGSGGAVERREPTGRAPGRGEVRILPESP